MAKRYTIQLLMNLAKSIGANPNKFMGTRTNITFLGKGPTKNPLFQSPIAGLETATEASLGPKESIIGAVEDAMGFASAQKLNSIQIQALGLNLENILKVYKPPVLPSASVTPIASGIEGLRRFPRETHKFFGRPLKDKDFTEIDRLFQGPITSTGPKGTRTWDFTRIPGAGTGAMTAKTGMSRAIARQILQQDTRLKLPEEVLISLRTGSRGPDPLDLMQKYYGRSIMNFDNFLNNINLQAGSPRDLATRVLSEVELVPQFAEGGLAGILQVPTKKAKGGRVGFRPGGRTDPEGGLGVGQQTTGDIGKTGWGGGGEGPQVTTVETPVIDRGQNVNLTPIQTFKGDSNYLDQVGLGINRNRAYAAGLLSVEDLMKGDIKPDLSAGYMGNNFSIAGQKTKDMTGLYGSTSVGPFNVQGSYEDVDGDVNRNISASTSLGNFDFGANYNPDGGLTYGGTYGKDIGGWKTGVNYDSDGNLMATIGTKFNKGGLAGILEV